MNILLIGSGGREHALAWALAKSPVLNKLFIAPGNAGTKACGENVALDIEDHEKVVAFCRENLVKLVVVGPEAPLVDGLADSLRANDLLVFGPSKAAAQLEGSKGFTKDLCQRANIPTAAYGRFTSALEAKKYLSSQSYPIVIKADGLAAGKGVVIAQDEAEALAAIDNCFEGAFGSAGAEVVIEAFLDGEEASFFVLTDGTNILPLATAQDHKRAYDNDAGPNTGGMGAYSPAPVMSEELIQQTLDTIIKPTVEQMRAEAMPFQGVLYAGLMITDKGPELIEYNARFGDPECQVLMLRLKSDFLPLLLACAEGTLDKVEAEWFDETALTVVMASQGYPGSYEKGTVIDDLGSDFADGSTMLFHAGTCEKDGQLLATGGRVLNITARGATVSEAKEKAYTRLQSVKWENGFYREDIGWRAVEREHKK
ncbi:phosphoribosylamine--glycine ligase [Polycladidibacter stylochi]|uniref:phosphoribosylamine--glycine ligase n=1 Tax=Polycladidibacter stylochi TaxID=1807766 RepID=UPI00082FA1FB|nr:phosphoribosylamine--glycine ligase [Pseudovibrio stylochi]